MSNIVDLVSLQRPRRADRGSVPQGGAIILLFTGVQYVRNEADIRMYEMMAAQKRLPAEGDRISHRKRAVARRKAATKH